MLISKNWLSQFVDLKDLSAQELAEKLTLSTVEIEGFEDQAEKLENMVVGEIKEIREHPNADSLEICDTDIGDEVVQIICGGSNIEEGLKVAVAKVGAKVRWHGEGELVELEETKIRGEKSNGMICAADEIGLGDKFPTENEKHILNLDHIEAEPGTPLAQALGEDDVVFDIDNKSMTHRPDLWGHYGIARELAVILDKELKEYEVCEIEEVDDVELEVEVEESELCPRYMAVVLDNIEVEQSPQWLQDRLRAVDIEPKNNIVDITNYLSYELGQPMHVFDKSKLVSNNIFVRNASPGEKIEALDGEEYDLQEGNLVIADEERPIAIAGIIGGANSEVGDETTSIVFESANFDKTNVRRSSQQLGVRTDSSARFEKGQDPNNAELALRKAVELTQEMCSDCEVVSNIVDKSDFDLDQGLIEISLDYLQRKIGAEIAQQEVEDILFDLGFEVERKDSKFLITVPTWRATGDINIKEDIVEEVARIYGYNNIDSDLPRFKIKPGNKDKLEQIQDKVTDILALDAGFTEVHNYSFVSPELVEKQDKNKDDYIELKNPIAKDRPYLRRSLVGNLVENVEYNLDRFDEVALFETGKVFDKQEKGESLTLENEKHLPKQDTHLAAIYSKRKENTPFFVVKSVLENLSDRLNISFEYKKQDIDSEVYHPGRYAQVFADGQEIGYITELHPIAQGNFGIDEKVGLCEINLDKLKEVETGKVYKKLSKYPSVDRDLAILVVKEVQHQDIQETIKEIDELIDSVELFDVYTGENIAKDKKSLAYHIHYRSDEKTLESENVDKIHKKVEQKLQDKFAAEIRE